MKILMMTSPRPKTTTASDDLVFLEIEIIDDDPRRRSSSDTRHALTVALVKPGRGVC